MERGKSFSLLGKFEEAISSFDNVLDRYTRRYQCLASERYRFIPYP